MSQAVIKEITEADIKQAFDDHSFSMVYQPQVSLINNNEIVGAEAFIRFNHPLYGMMMPASFLDMINDMGLMLELTQYVVAYVAADWALWKDLGFDLKVSINIDASLLNEANLSKELGPIISESKIPRQRVTLEFANCCHNGLLEKQIEKQLLSLRMKGYRISIDDYGKGSIDDSIFAKLPMDEIKLDRSVITNVTNLEDKKNATRQALHLANKYGLHLVAVGVEDQKTATWLAKIGCDTGQGYFFGKPLNNDEFLKEYLQSDRLLITDNSKPSILLLEDDVQYQSLLTQSLSEQFNVQVADSVKEAIQLISVFSPDIIISDVFLPDGSGIDFCREHVDTNTANSTNIIFISGGQDFNNKLQAYEVGASDFIQKPFSIIEFMTKVKQVANYQARRQDLINQTNEANALAMSSLKETAYFGEIVHFLKNLLQCQDEGQITNLLFNFMGQKSLFTSVEFRDDASSTHFDQVNGVCSPIELNIFGLLRDKGRLYPFSHCLLVNDNHVSFLVKNMPNDDDEQGKIRDYVAVLIEGMESRYKELLRQRVLNSVSQKLDNLARKLLDVVNKDQKQNTEALDKYAFELQMSFHTLDLTQEQESHITGIVNEMLKTKESEEQSAEDISKEVSEILDSVNKALAKIDKENSVQKEVQSSDTVELF
jgi:EAL domain-containing protein (putative c-di-GMP-specific phosphodiesterase class I)/DNA-binding response OmpR family regulator